MFKFFKIGSVFSSSTSKMLIHTEIYVLLILVTNFNGRYFLRNRFNAFIKIKFVFRFVSLNATLKVQQLHKDVRNSKNNYSLPL